MKYSLAILFFVFSYLSYAQPLIPREGTFDHGGDGVEQEFFELGLRWQKALALIPTSIKKSLTSEVLRDVLNTVKLSSRKNVFINNDLNQPKTLINNKEGNIFTITIGQDRWNESTPWQKLGVTLHDLMADSNLEKDTYPSSAEILAYAKDHQQIRKILLGKEADELTPQLIQEISYETSLREGFSSFDQALEKCAQFKQLYKKVYLLVYCSLLGKEWSEWTVKLDYFQDWRFLGYKIDYDNFQTASAGRNATSGESSYQSNGTLSSSKQSPGKVILFGLYAKGTSTNSTSTHLDSAGAKRYSNEDSFNKSYQHEQYSKHTEIREVKIPYHYFAEMAQQVYGLRIYGIGKYETLPWRKLYSSLEMLQGTLKLTFTTATEALIFCNRSLRKTDLGPVEQTDLLGTRCKVPQVKASNGEFYYEVWSQNPFLTRFEQQ